MIQQKFVFSYSVLYVVCLMLNYGNATEVLFNSELSHKVDNLKQKLAEYETTVEDPNECFSTYYNILQKWNQSDATLNFLVKLIDSSSKIQSGITGLNLYDFGNFDICYDLEANIGENLVYGKYCLAYIPVTLSVLENQDVTIKQLPNKRFKNFGYQPEDFSSTTLMFQHGFCVPSVCSAEDVQGLVNNILNDLPFVPRPKFSEEMCYVKNESPELSNGAIFTIVFLAVILSLVILSSIYEYSSVLNNQKPPHEILLAFSAISNGKKLINSTKNPDQLLCLNGIKAISMAWVIIGHEYTMYQGGPTENLLDTLAVTTEKSNMWILASTLSVDSFFTVGGLLTVYVYLKSRDKGTPFNIPLYYLHRYLRLTPALAVLLVIFVTLLDYLGNGPLWYTVDPAYVQICRQNWWALLLYIQNFVGVTEQCIGQSWYLSVDFQMFLLSPIVLYSLTKKPKLGYLILGVLFILGFVVPTVLSYVYELPAFPFDGNSEDYFRYYYSQTQARFGPYVVGMIFGTIIYKVKRQQRVPPKTKKNIFISFGIWIFAIGGLVSSLYCGAALLGNTNITSAAFYNGFHKNTWSISLGLVILLCVTGFGGPVDVFLSFPIFQFITKLSYCMYLLHTLVLAIRVFTTRNTLRFSHLGVMHIYWADFMATLGLSFIFCLCFEAPMVVLEKYLLDGLMGKLRKDSKVPKEP